MTDYKQFDIRYFDFTYNNERVRTFTELSDAMEFMEWIVLCREHQMRFIADYKQFDIRYFDFTYNNERVRTFTELSDAMEFMEWIVLCREHQMRFIALESVY